MSNITIVWDDIRRSRRVRVDADMQAIRPALFLAVSVLALQGCAGINEIAGNTGRGGFVARNGEFTPEAVPNSPTMSASSLQQSEQVISMDAGADAPTTYIQASDPIDAPPPPIAIPATPQTAPRPAPESTPVQTTAASGRPLMLVPAPGQEMMPAPPASVPAQPSPKPPTPMMPSPQTASAPPAAAPVTKPVQTAPQPVLATREPAMPEPQTTALRGQGREFIPASVSARNTMPSAVAPGDMPLSPGQRNVLERFTILDQLLDEGLITRGERDARRAENIGALLAYSQKAPAQGLERDVPDGDAISSRLTALKRSLEMRAITPRQHAVERSMILDALLSGQPRSRAMPKPPPADILEAAAIIGHLERLRADGVISDAEFNAEKDAIDAYFVTGSFETASPMAPATTEMEKAEIVAVAPSANLGLHLASYRSQKAAQDGWTQISKKYSAQLNGLNSNIRRVELGGGKGTFYRLLAGPVQTRDQAARLCQQLKRSSQYCDPLSLDG